MRPVKLVAALAAGGVSSSALLFWLRSKTLATTGGAGMDNLQLVSAQVVFRHGARTPIHPWRPELFQVGENAVSWADLVPAEEEHSTRIPVNIHKVTRGSRSSISSAGSEETVPLRWGRSTWFYSKLSPKHPAGELTELGFQQAVELGKELRERYIIRNGLVSEVYSPSGVYVRTSNYNRTKQTAQGVLTGMFGAHKPAEDVVFHTVPWAEEVLVGNSRICNTYRQLFNHAEVSMHGELVAKERSMVIDKLNIPADKVQFVYLRDVLVGRQAHGLPLPPQVTPELFDAIDAAAAKSFHDGFHGDQRIAGMHVSCGVMLNTVLKNLKSDEDDQPRLYLYSMHDSLISPLVAAVGAEDGKWPSFCSHVSFELYQCQADREKRYVKVAYNDKDVTLDGCSSVFCPLKEFEAHMQQFAIDAGQYKKLCSDSLYKKPESTAAQKAATYL